MKYIKFRAWDGGRQQMSYKVQVGNLDPNDPNYTAGAIYAEDEWRNFDEHSDIHIMQSTGLFDRHGKEIWEGDVIEFVDKWEWYRSSYAIKMLFANQEEKQLLKQKFDAAPMYRFAVEPFTADEGYNLSVYDNNQYRYEVVGNIFENPELLKKEVSK